MAEPSTDTTFDVPQGQLQLRRFPRRERELLRAWDAGDSYLLQHLHEDEEGAGNGAAWIINDGFGALTVALAAAGRPLYMSSDSWLAHEGMRANLRDNGLAESSVHLLDSLASFRAVASAKHNWQTLFGESRSAVFEVGDCLAPVAISSAEVILCNPPFHQGNTMGDATAWRMLTGARRALRSGGTLLIVGNRHLAYHAKLRRLFGNCEVLHSDSKFVVLRSRSC